ncbi:putative phospholipid-binding lipoprotein MlaA [bacterium HR30]|nr:putative phospholipid-binding lipoprotein MlaA [bacterium HR30]
MKQAFLRRCCLRISIAGLFFLRAGLVFAQEYDPWQRFNRAMFTFNDTIDTYALEPVAKAWDRIVPERVEQSVTNLFQNVYTPLVAINNVLQGKPHHAAEDVARFMANSTFGLFGLFDVASHWGLEKHDEDFGQTLAVWGVPAGPYLVLPFVGPSSPRDAVGYAVDSVATVYWFFADIRFTIGPQTVQVVNSRAQALDAVRELKTASVDYYAAVRNAYLQRRARQIKDQQENAGPDEELYRIEE